MRNIKTHFLAAVFALCLPGTYASAEVSVAGQDGHMAAEPIAVDSESLKKFLEDQPKAAVRTMPRLAVHAQSA